MPGLPTGTVTFLFTDIEGSTRLLEHLGDRYADALTQYRNLLCSAVQERGGQEVDTQGDAYFFAFPRARDAVAAAVAAQQGLLRHPWTDGASVRVRMGLHTGEALATETRYVGMDVHRAARISAAAHGGQILLSDTTHALVAKDLPRGLSLRDLGEHRLKDLAHPLRLFQVVAGGLPTGFPALKSLDTLPNNLPRQLTSFVGRQREMAELKRLLSITCLLTLTGVGGAGKTRLALQVAADLLDEYPEGVWLVEFSSLSDPTLVPQTVASVLDVPEQPGRSLTDTLTDYLRPKSLLLILDNCEHLLSGCARLAEILLRASPHLRILATSREGLGIAGELTHRVPSLSLPDPQHLPPLESLPQYEAVRLFTERAAFSQPGFAVTASNAPAIAQICSRLDGVPLAIELAAARVKVLSVEQISKRLDDRFRLLTGGTRTGLPRQQTLRATMDWSYELLPEKEREVLRRLSVFAGGWTLETAESVCSGKCIKGHEVLDLLTHLVEKSLCVVDTQSSEARYRLPETVRQYGLDRLLESGEAADVRKRHRDWYLDLAERAEPELFGPGQEVWLNRLETEHDNLRAALEWSRTEEGGAEAGLRLVGAIHGLWFMHGYWSEGRMWFESALARSGEGPRSALPKALQGAANLTWRQGDYGRATALCKKGLVLCRELGDKEGTTRFLIQLGIVVARQGDPARATALFEDGLTMARALGNKWVTSMALAQLGMTAVRVQRDYERAAALLGESLSLARETGDKWRIAYSLRGAGIVALHQGDHGRAAAFYTESLALCRELGERWVTEECLDGLAGVACAQGRHEQAARLFGAAETLRETLGRQPLWEDQADHDQRVASTRDALGDVVFAAAWAEGRAMTLEQAVEYALAVATGRETSSA